MTAHRIQCRGCKNAEITVISTPLFKTNGYYNMQQMNVLSIYCKQKKTIVKYPYEKCNIKSNESQKQNDNHQSHKSETGYYYNEPGSYGKNP